MVQNLWCEKAEFASSRDDDGYGDQVESGRNYHWVGRYIYIYLYILFNAKKTFKKHTIPGLHQTRL